MRKRLVVCILILLGATGATCCVRPPLDVDEPPTTLAAIRKGDLETSPGTGKWNEITVLVPVATYESGRWIAGEQFDQLPEEMPYGESMELLPPAYKQYWKALADQSFCMADDPASRFSPEKLVVYNSFDTWHLGLTGTLRPERKILDQFDSEWDGYSPAVVGPLVVNRRIAPPSPPKVARFDERILALARRCLEQAQTYTLQKNDMATLELVVTEPLKVQEWHPFRVSKRESAVWVEVGGMYEGKLEEGQEDEARKGPWDAHYFGILKRIGRQYTPLWEYGCLFNDLVTIRGNYYSFEGCCDVSGDGQSEVLLREIGYEWWEYQLYERQEAGYVLVACAAWQGL